MSGYKPSGHETQKFVEFPKWVYHKELKAVIVQDREEQDALGEEWYEKNGSSLQKVAEPISASPEFVEYPKYKYHIDGTYCIVDDAEADSDLGPGWHNSPSAAKEASEIPQEGNPDLLNMNAAQLRKIATDLGIETKATWKVGRLIQAIESVKPADTE